MAVPAQQHCMGCLPPRETLAARLACPPHLCQTAGPMTSEPTCLGTVTALNRYPVKSMQAEPLEAAELFWTGLHGDRQYAFVKADNASAFPWLTARDLPALVLHRARYADPGDPRRARVEVVAPDGAACDLADPALAERLARDSRHPVRLMQTGRGAYDAMPVSVLATTAADAIGRAHGAPVGLGRFRANVIIQPDDPAATDADWCGRTLLFGDRPDAPGLRLDWAIPRCAMIAVDPATAARDPAVLRTVVQRFGNRAGTYCAVHRPGTIQVGDRVRLAAA